MIEYNLVAEYAALTIIVAVLLSFSRDYDARTAEYRFLKLTYVVSLISVLVTISALVSGVPGTGALHIAVATISNILYFIFIPSVSLCYLIYAKLMTAMKFDQLHYWEKLRPMLLTYMAYVIIVLVGIAWGKVFHVTEAEGYVRGDWFQLPYIIVTINILWVVSIVCRNLKTLPRDVIKVMLTTAGLAVPVLWIQFHEPNTIMTGVLSTMSVLGIHLYAQNVRKSTDQLTMVYNRMSLVHTLENYVRKNENFSLYIFSLRGMKVINTRYGIDFGDKVLMRMAHILTQHASDDNVFRYAGDEFALLINRNQKNQEKLVAKIVAELDEPQEIDGNEISLDMVYARVDYSLFGSNVRALLSAADYSIHSLKERLRGGRYLYDTNVVKMLITQSEMVEQLKKTVAKNMLEMHYQPVYSIKDRCYTQAEALVRMRNEEGKLIPPGEFISLAVKTGLIVPMTYLILERVCRDLRYLLDRYGERFPLKTISVNFPYLQFTDADMPQKVMEILSRYDIPCHMIKIEITEREMVADTKKTKETMLEMREHGFAFALDDFGMDYSNVSVVLELPLENIKLDRGLLLATYEKPENKEFFHRLVTAFGTLGCTIISEGVEEREQYEFVKSCGCEYVQGYYFSRPLTRDGLEKILKLR